MLLYRSRTCSTTSAFIVIFVTIALSNVAFSARELSNNDQNNNNNENAERISQNPQQFWQRIATKFLDSYSNDAILERWNKIKPSLTSDKVNGSCVAVLEHLLKSPLKEEWSAKMLDSMNFRPAGLLSGTTTELGDFDQCLSISSTFDSSPFVAKYCFATVNIPRKELFQPTFNFSYLEPKWIGDYVEKWHYNDNYYALATALCFPSTCHQNEIRYILLQYYDILQHLDFNVQYCQSVEEPVKPDARVWNAVYILLGPMILVVLGTIAEFFQKSGDAKLNLLTSFSLIHNTKVLIKVTHDHVEAGESGHFQYIHGIRAIASFYIIFCHAFGLMIVPLYMKISVYARYPYDMQEVTKYMATQPIFNGGGLIVQTFFIMSGMLLTYNALATKLKIKFIPYVMLRWLRYTPPLIGAICMTLALQLFGNGPLFHQDLLWPTFRRCYDTWWQNLLYINNFRDFDDHCMLQTWYLAAEMQLHIVAFLLLLAYLKSPKRAYQISLLLAGVGALLIILIVGFGFTKMPLFHIFPFTQFPVQNSAARLLYFLPYMQFVAYFFGTIIGQMLLEKRRLPIPRIGRTVLSIISLGIFIGFPLSTYQMVNDDVYVYDNPTWWDGIHYVIYLVLWCAANAWFFYQCSMHPESSIARFLSAKIFQPFSRLSFSLYLVHVMTIWYNAHQTRSTISFVNLNELYKTISHTILQSIILAYFLYLTFEAPFVNWMKYFLKKEKKLTVNEESSLKDAQILQENSSKIDEEPESKKTL